MGGRNRKPRNGQGNRKQKSKSNQNYQKNEGGRLSKKDIKNMSPEALELLVERITEELPKTKFYENIMSKSDDEKNSKPAPESQSEESSEEQSKKGKKNKENSQQQQQSNLKLVDPGRNGANQFSASGEFTEEQLVKMYRQMQADRARTQQLFNHVTSPYNMHGSTGESMAMAAGAFVGFALGRTMYKASRIGHLRQDWRLRREVLRQERGYYNQGTQSRFGGILSGFSNAASSFRQGWQRGRRKDINMDVQQPSATVEVEAAEPMTGNMPTNEPNFGIA